MHSNCRGVQSKLKSIEAIVKNLNIQVLTLNEINLRKNKKLKVEGFKSFNRNRSEGHMGGVATCVVDEDNEHTLKVSEGNNDNEFIVTRNESVPETYKSYKRIW